MYIFKIYGKEYKVRFTYKAICRGDVLDKFTSATAFESNDPRDVINKMVTATAETLIAGLQKYHSDEFGYDTEEERLKLVEKFLDMFDDYEDESTEENPQSAYTLFSDLQKELEKNGFLSAMAKVAEETAQMEKAVEMAKTEMETEPVRTKVMSIRPTESES